MEQHMNIIYIYNVLKSVSYQMGGYTFPILSQFWGLFVCLFDCLFVLGGATNYLSYRA
jgi:hypothetical protein